MATALLNSDTANPSARSETRFDFGQGYEELYGRGRRDTHYNDHDSDESVEAEEEEEEYAEDNDRYGDDEGDQYAVNGAIDRRQRPQDDGHGSGHGDGANDGKRNSNGGLPEHPAGDVERDISYYGYVENDFFRLTHMDGVEFESDAKEENYDGLAFDYHGSEMEDDDEDEDGHVDDTHAVYRRWNYPRPRR